MKEIYKFYFYNFDSNFIKIWKQETVENANLIRPATPETEKVLLYFQQW